MTPLLRGLRTSLLALLSLPAWAQLPPAPAAPVLQVVAYAIEGNNPLSAQDTAQVLQPFTGQVTSIERLREAARRLEAELKARGYGFYRVSLPPQTLTDTVHLKLVLFALGKVEVTGNQFTPEEQVRAAFPSLVQGQSPNTQQVSRNVAMFNTQDVRQVTITLLESDTRDAIDARLDIKDSKPAFGFATLQNNGNAQTGKWRSTLGYQDANFLNRDQSLTATFTTSPSQPDDVKQYGFTWSMPLYALASNLSAYAVYSDVNSGKVAGFFDVAGQGTFVGAKWTYQLLPVDDVTQNIALGVDLKQYVNKVVFNGQNTGTDVAALPATLAYGGRWRQPQGDLDWHLEYAGNLAYGARNDEASYAANRAGAPVHWSALRLNASASVQLESAWTLQAHLSAQAAQAPLISGEQFGIGGSTALRGYAEREASGDSGQSLVLEAWTPVLLSSLRALAFVEGGAVHTLNAQAGSNQDTALASWGVGLRWQPDKDLSVSADVAQALVDGSETRAFDWRGHLALVFKF